MWGKIGGNGRHTLVTAVFLLTTLWLWKSGHASSLFTGGGGAAPGLHSALEPRQNTTWHRQLALEIPTDKTALKAVATPHGPIDRTRVALLIEDRPLPYLVPLLLHFIAVVPPEWSFRFMGSAASLAMMEANPTVRRYVAAHKLFLDLAPYHIVPKLGGYYEMNTLLSRAWLYEEWLWPAEWVFLFQDDSMICANSPLTLNDFVAEGWSFIAGSGPGTTRPHSQGGGFSLRYVPHLARQLEVRSFEQWAEDGEFASEDYYFTMAMWDLPEAKMPVGNEAIRFGVVNAWPEDPAVMPMGFHSFSSDGLFRGPKGQENQDRAYAYCPELAIISVGRWDCQCAPNPSRPGGLGG